MRIDFEWLDAPEEGDPLEFSTMARLTCSVGEDVVTRVHDRATRSERDGIHVPLYPLADWLVTHWWSLLYEPWPFLENFSEPGMSVKKPIQDWLQRHCLRAAIPGYASPYTCIYSQGNQASVVSRPDLGNQYTATPVRFLQGSEAAVDRDALRGILSDVVEAVLARVEGVADARVESLRTDWQTICSAPAQEAEFCRAAGRLGLDPLDVDAWPPSVASWFEQVPDGALDSAFVIDLLEAPDLALAKPSQHAAFDQIVRRFNLRTTMNVRGPRFDDAPAFVEGYSLASWIRQQLNIADEDRCDDLQTASEVTCGRPFIQESADIPEGRVLAVTGWNAEPHPVVVTRSTGAPHARRFLRARALFLALRGAARGPRLVTEARTRDQRASRAFGAELLAPRAGVITRYEAAVRRFGRDEAELDVASHYNVSPMVIRHQLVNARPGAPTWG